MNRYSLLALGLALTLSCAGSRANDQAGAVGTDNQPGAASANQQPPTAPTTPQPDIAQPTPQPDNGQGNQQPNADQTNPQPNNAQVNPQPNVGQPNPQPDNGQTNPQPNSGQPGAVGNAQQGAMASPDIHSPLQEFVSHQVDEVASLAPQFDAFRAANRADAIPVLYHMVRDHVLVADAARNLLARRGQISRPVTLAPATDVVAVTPDDMLRHDIEAHQQALSSTQQLLANSTSSEERNIYQQAVNATQKHLGWLQSLSQGQQVALGFFEPTIPLNRIAGYREQVGQARTGRSSQQLRRSRTASYRRGMRSRSHRHHYYHRYYRGTSRYR